MTTRVVKGSLWTFAGQVMPIGISLLTAPFVIRLLGSEGYGVLILVGLIPTYFSFADFGMGIASTKFASEAYARGSLDDEARIVRTAGLITLLTSLPIAVVLILFSGSIIAFFGVSDAMHAEASTALKFGAVTFVLTFLNSIFNTPQLTRLRMELNTFVASGFRILGMIAVPFVLYFGGGIAGAVLVLMAAQLLTLLGNLFVSERLLPGFFGTSINSAAVRPMLKFGGALVGAGIAGILLSNAEKGILAATVSAEALGFYSVAFTVAGMMTLFSTSMTKSLMPAFSQLQGPKNLERLDALYSRALRVNLILMVPALVLLAIAAKTFFTLWAGEAFGRESTFPFYILLSGLAFNMLAYLPHVSIMAAGRTDIFAKLYWLELIIYVVLVWALTTNFGIIGAAAAWSIRVVADAFLLFWFARRIAGVTFTMNFANRFVFAAAVMAAPLVPYFYYGRIDLAVITIAAASLFVYSLLVWKFVLGRDEVNWLSGRFRTLFSH